MKFDNWTKDNKMEHNVLLMVQDAKKQWENIFCHKKVADIVKYRAFIIYIYNGLFSANIVIYSD